MKDKLLDKTGEIRVLLNEHDVPDNRVHELDAFENNLRLIPNDRLENASSNEVLDLLEQAKSMELEFEFSHPHFTAAMKEIVRLLSGMGI